MAPRWIGIHLRIFTRSTDTAGVYIPAELAGMQENLCNLAPEEFTLILSMTLALSFQGFLPTHSYVASNVAEPEQVHHYIAGFPGPRMNPYTIKNYNSAVTVHESVEALASVLVDAMLCARANYFVGNACSTMSEYIYQLRLRDGLSINTSLLLAGVQ